MFDSKAFSEDVTNAVCDYSADGIDAFDKCLQGAPLLEPEVVQEIQKGTERLGQDLLDKMESNLALFQRLCSTTIFRTPAPATLPSVAIPMPSPVRSSAPNEHELDSKLSALRMQLQQIGAGNAELKSEIRVLDREIKDHGHIAVHTAALASTLNMPSAGEGQCSEPQQAPGIAYSVAAITAAVQQLQALLQRAQKLRTLRQPLAPTHDATAAVEFKSSQLAKACGTLQDLQKLKGLLEPAWQEQGKQVC